MRGIGRLGAGVFRRGRVSQSIFGAAHDSGPPAWCAAWSGRHNFDSGPYIIVTNEKLQVPQWGFFGDMASLYYFIIPLLR